MWPAAVVAALLAGACASGPVKVEPGPSRPIAAVGNADARAEVGDAGNGATLVASWTDARATVWQSDQALSQWIEVATYPAPTALALPPHDVTGVRAVYATASVVTVDGADSGQAQSIGGVAAGETVTALLIAGGRVPGVLALAEHRRGAAPAAIRLLFARLDGTPLLFSEGYSSTTDPGQSRLAACASGEGTWVAVSRFSSFAARGSEPAAVPAIELLSLAPNGSFSHLATVAMRSAASGDAPALSPADIAIRCDGQGPAEVMARSGAVWRWRRDGGAWIGPERVVLRSAGYGSRGRSVAVCGSQLVWVDDRLERGATGLTSVLSGSYRGWRINTLFASVDAAPDSDPRALSSNVGQVIDLAATDSPRGCHIAWIGRSRVEASGGDAAEHELKLFHVVAGNAP